MWAWDKNNSKCMCSNCIYHLPPRNTLSLPSNKSSSAHAGFYYYFVCVCAIIWPSLIAMHPIPHSASYYWFPCLGATLYSLPLNPQNTIYRHSPGASVNDDIYENPRAHLGGWSRWWTEDVWVCRQQGAMAKPVQTISIGWYNYYLYQGTKQSQCCLRSRVYSNSQGDQPRGAEK